MAYNVAATVTLRSYRNASLFWIVLWLIFGPTDHGVISACRLQLSPPFFSDTSVRPSLLRTTPVKKLRTEWGCQPVAFMIVAMVAPCRRWSISITRACFEAPRLGAADCCGGS